MKISTQIKVTKIPINKDFPGLLLRRNLCVLITSKIKISGITETKNLHNKS